jgi:hypothetical protein
MECHYKSKDGRLVFKIEGGNQKALFQAISDLQDCFEAESKCGLCGNVDIRFRVREVSKNGKQYKYFEMVCNHCFARFDFGQNQVGETLFPKRKDENGNYLPNHGWYKYTPKED